MPRPTAIDAARLFRDRLQRNETAAFERMARIYSRIYGNLRNEVQQLADELSVMESPSPDDIIRLARTQRILKQVREQVTRFGGTVADEVINIQSLAIRQGVRDAVNLMTLSLPPLSDELQRQIVGSFATLPASAIEAAAGLLGADSPLATRLEAAYGEFVAGQVEAHIVDGLAVGQNPRRIARLLERNLQSSLGSGLTSALTTVRTANIKSYQLANHATYQANPRIVPAWTWSATLDDRTCLSCINQHGKEFPITETLRDHHNGRCAPIPRTISYADLGLNIPETVPPFERGPDWFSRQSETKQRKLMGPAMFEAWKRDRFEFDDLTKPYDDDVYGELLREASLKDLLGDEAKEFYR